MYMYNYTAGEFISVLWRVHCCEKVTYISPFSPIFKIEICIARKKSQYQTVHYINIYIAPIKLSALQYAQYTVNA